MPFYRVAISKARWATGLFSFDLKSIQGHIERKAKEEGIEVPADSSKLIEKVEVPTLKVNDLLSKHHIQKFEVLCIDTEGYDFEILKLIDLKKYAPEVIFFESKNLIDEDFKQAKSMLIDLGYKLFSSPLNINILSI
jgi:FkbM family methyltransferase